jgi:hypothetical protein
LTKKEYGVEPDDGIEDDKGGAGETDDPESTGK